MPRLAEHDAAQVLCVLITDASWRVFEMGDTRKIQRINPRVHFQSMGSGYLLANKRARISSVHSAYQLT